MTGSAVDKYIDLLSRCVSGETSVDEFKEDFISSFKDEKEIIGGRLYEELQRLFGDIDATTSDKDLIASSPDFYISEEDLIGRIPNYLTRIILLSKNRG